MDNNLIDDRHIRVFISSTFRDMEKEREQLIKKVFPMLRKKAAKRGVVVTELDLRWGVTQEESENGKVLEICLNEIDNSRPFFIGLLGDRYGWCPSEHELDKNHNIEELFPWVRQAIAEGKSVTEMEFLYGALSPQLFQDKHIDAYFWIKKNAANDDERLAKLKTEVRENLNYPCSEYTSPSDLGNQVAAIFEKILDERFPQQQLSEVDSFRLEQELYKSRLTRTFLPIEQNIKVLDTFLQDDEKNVIALVGEQGSGKSATMANWTAQLKDKTDYHCITCFMQASNNGADINYVLSYVNEELRKILGQDITDNPLVTNNDEEDTFKHLFQEVQKSMNLLLILDCINVLDEPEDKFLNWLPDVFGGSKIILTTTKEDATYQSVVRKGYDIANISLMDDGKAKEQYIDLFLGQYGKSLSVEQKNKLALSPITSNPSILHTILVELKNNSSYEALDQAIDIFSKASNMDDVYRIILDNAERTFEKEFVVRALRSIAVSRNGLDEKTLMAITEAVPLHWSQFFCAFSEHLYLHQGLVSFINPKFKSVIVDRYQKNVDVINQKNGDVINLKNVDVLRRIIIHHAFHTCKDAGLIRDVPYQLYFLKELKRLNRFLASESHLIPYLYWTDQRNLYRYWEAIREAHLPKLRYYLNFSKTEIGENTDKILFFNKVSEYRLCSYFCIRELINNRIREILRRDKNDYHSYYKAVALWYLSESLSRMAYYRLSRRVANRLIYYVSKHPIMQQTNEYFRQMGETIIANCNLVLGNTEGAEAIYDTLRHKDVENGNLLSLDGRATMLINAIFTYLDTDRAQAVACFFEAENIYERLIKINPKAYIGYIFLLQFAPNFFRNDVLIKYLNKAIELASLAEAEGVKIPDSSMAVVYSNLANAIINDNRDLAVHYCDMAMNKYAVYIKEMEDYLSIVYCNCAVVYTYAGEEEKARNVVRLYVDLSPRHYDKNNNSILWATIYCCQGLLDFSSNPESSERFFRKSISEFDMTGDNANNNLNLGYANDYLGRLLYEKGEYKSAIKYFRAAIRIYDNIMSQNNNVDLLCMIIESNNYIGYACVNMGSINDAKIEIKDNLSRLDQIPPSHPRYYRSKVTTYCAMAYVLSPDGNGSEAKPYYIKAIDAAQEGNLGDETIDRLKNYLSQVS